MSEPEQKDDGAEGAEPEADALLEAFGRRRPPHKLEVRESQGADAAEYQAEHPPAPRAEHQTLPNARVIVEGRSNTNPGIGPKADDAEIVRQLEAAKEAPPEKLAPEEYEALRQLRETPPRQLLEGVETDPSAHKHGEQRRTWAYAALAVVVALGIVAFVVLARGTKPADTLATTTTSSTAAPPTSTPPSTTTTSAVTATAPPPTLTTTVTAPLGTLPPQTSARVPPTATGAPSVTVTTPSATQAPTTTAPSNTADPLLTGH